MIDELVQGYHHLRRKLAREFGPDEGADIAQASFERALCYAREHVVVSPVGLIFQIAGNLQIDRGRRRRPATVELDEMNEMPWDVTPEREYACRQTVERLCVVLDSLPPRQREAFVLCKLHDMTYHEAAAEMDISPTVVRQYLVDAMRACRQTVRSEID
ncbi:RNA polymerase sigma factor [Paraburkholderia sp.]|uniref:RNA polymerase sigma factor n=1 Tax=Paraburkholderia sp. TaxID=1926495 RepID=UPI003D6E319F